MCNLSGHFVCYLRTKINQLDMLVMKKTRMIGSIAIITLAIVCCTLLAMLSHARHENKRLAENNLSLNSQLSHSNHLVASQRLSIGRLRMTIGELEELRQNEAERIKALGIRLRDARQFTLTATSTLLDTLLPAPSSERLSDSLTTQLQWSDHWVNLTLTPHPDGSHLHLQSRDTLTQVVYRIPHRWWIFRWGTKALRQEIRTSNPHTHLVYSEYIQIEK